MGTYSVTTSNSKRLDKIIVINYIKVIVIDLYISFYFFQIILEVSYLILLYIITIILTYY